MKAVAEDYAKEHMGELFEDDRKTAESASATYCFRENSRRLVQFAWWTVNDSIASLEAAGLDQFVTTQKSLNKDELKTKLTPEELKEHGLKVVTKENFEITPHADIAAAV